MLDDTLDSHGYAILAKACLHRYEGSIHFFYWNLTIDSKITVLE
jgi:hypothetical protein